MVLIGSVTSRNVTLVQLHFIDNVCQIFEDFLKSFQSDKPQIHRLYDVMGNLMIRLLLRFVIKEKIQTCMSLIYQMLICQDLINYKIVKSLLEKVVEMLRFKTKEMSSRK